MSNEKDKLVQELFNIVKIKKAEIAKTEKPNWITNCSYTYDQDSNSRINIQTVSKTDELVKILANLISKSDAYKKASEELEVKSEFSWMGFSYEDWKTDLKTRIDKIEISTKKKETGGS